MNSTQCQSLKKLETDATAGLRFVSKPVSRRDEFLASELDPRSEAEYMIDRNAYDNADDYESELSLWLDHEVGTLCEIFDGSKLIVRETCDAGCRSDDIFSRFYNERIDAVRYKYERAVAKLVDSHLCAAFERARIELHFTNDSYAVIRALDDDGHRISCAATVRWLKDHRQVAGGGFDMFIGERHGNTDIDIYYEFDERLHDFVVRTDAHRLQSENLVDCGISRRYADALIETIMSILDDIDDKPFQDFATEAPVLQT